jgi:hypothetical protein
MPSSDPVVIVSAESEDPPAIRPAGILSRAAVVYLVCAGTAVGLKAFLFNGCNRGDDTFGALLYASLLLVVLLAYLTGWSVGHRDRLTLSARLTVIPVILVGIGLMCLGFWYASTLLSGCPA